GAWGATGMGADCRAAPAESGSAVGGVPTEREPLAPELPIDRPADLLQCLALRGESRRQLRLSHTNVAVGTVVALEAGEQRAVADGARAVTVAVDAVEHGGGGAGRGIGLGRVRGVGNDGGREDALGGHAEAR